MKTADEISEMRKLLQEHMRHEEDVLVAIKEQVEHLTRDQEYRHTIIDNQLKDLTPIRDGLLAAGTIKRAILWVAGFIAGFIVLVEYFKRYK